MNCLDDWALHPELDRETRLEDARLLSTRAEQRFPLLSSGISDVPGVCAFYDRFAPEPLDRPLDGGGAAILVVANRADPITPFIESEQLVTALANGFLVEVDHPSHVVYPANDCVNRHVHAALIDLAHPSRDRTVCDRDAASTGSAPTGGERRLPPGVMEQLVMPYCVTTAETVVPEADDGAVDAACQQFTEQVVAKMDESAIGAVTGGFGSEDDTVWAVLMLLNALVSNGVVLPEIFGPTDPGSG